MYDKTPCSGGCGKMINNASGVCRDCRKQKCADCGREYAVKGVKSFTHRYKCSQCRKLKAKSKRDGEAVT